MAIKQTFTGELDATLLDKARAMASAQGREVVLLVEEALAQYVDKDSPDGPRAHVMAEYESSIAEYGRLYERLAK